MHTKSAILGTLIAGGIPMWSARAFAPPGVRSTPRYVPSPRNASPESRRVSALGALSEYFENDIVSVRLDPDESSSSPSSTETETETETENPASASSPRLYVVTQYGGIAPLCIFADDNPTDLHLDPRGGDEIDADDSAVVKCYGEGYFSQRVVPSLGGGPGYGAEANPVWSIEEDILEEIEADGVCIPTLDLGIAHGEKARGGAL